MPHPRLPIRIRPLPPHLFRRRILQHSLQKYDFFNIRMCDGGFGHGAGVGAKVLQDRLLGVVGGVVVQEELPDIVVRGDGVPGLGGFGGYTGRRRWWRDGKGFLLHHGSSNGLLEVKIFPCN